MGGRDTDGDLIDLVYDAAVEPELWTTVIERFVDRVGGANGGLVDQNVENGKGAGLFVGIDPAMLAPYFDYYASRNVLLKVADPRAFMRDWTPRILTDEDWLPKDALVRTEYYNGFLKAIDAHSVLMVRLAAHDMNTSILNIGRAERRGRFEAGDIAAVERLHPHLIRAFRLGRKLAAAAQVDAGAADLLDRSPYGVFVVGEDGQIRHANRVAEDLLADRDALTAIGGRLRATNPEAGRRLQGLIGIAASRDPDQRGGGSMPLETPLRRSPLSVIVAPVRSERWAVFHGGPSVIVCVTDPDAGVSLPEHRLCDLFGLTAAEARVALALIEGRNPKEAADALGLSFYTVRCHLVRIFDKTGTNRQAELVRLLMRVIGIGLG